MVTRIERSILSWVEEHLTLLAVLLFSVLGIALRLPLMDFISGDSTFFLLPWYEEIRENGLYVQVGNYNLLYQFLIYLMTKLPLEPLYAYKLLSIAFDFLLAMAAAGLTGRIAKRDIAWKSVFAYGAVLLSPITALNSSAWAQCDSIYVLFALLAIAGLCKEKYIQAMISLGFAFAFKLQAVFLLPLFLFVYFQKRQFSVLQFLLIPVVVFLTGLPALFFDRNPMETFQIYGEQTGTYPYLSMNYPSVWLLFAQGMNQTHYELLRLPAMVLTVAALALQMLNWYRKHTEIRGRNVVCMAFLLVFTCVIFLPAMHERYGYLYEILALMIACIHPKTLPLCLGLLGISLCTYGSYLFKIETLNLITLTVLNLGIYIGYVVSLEKYMDER